MPNYSITKIDWSSPPSTSQVISIEHKVSTDPDGSYILDTNSLLVPISGVLGVPFVISGLDWSTNYTIRGTNNCGGTVFLKTIAVPANPCPEIIDITGTVNPD